MIDMQTGRSYGADICYGILSRYKQVAPDGDHACPRKNGDWALALTVPDLQSVGQVETTRLVVSTSSDYLLSIP